MMTAADLQSILPLVIIAGGMLIATSCAALKRKGSLPFLITLIALASSFTAVVVHWSRAPHAIGDLFLVDRFSMYFQGLVLLATFVVACFSAISLKRSVPQQGRPAYYLLLLLAALGAMTLVISTHFISFFVGLEILNISLYTLISFYKDRPSAIEAGLKYLILAAMSSAILLFGMALIYATTGTLSFQALAAFPTTQGSFSVLIEVTGIGLMMSGIGFKLALVPFHMWAPDVYDGASAPISAFIASVSKGAVMAVLLRFFAMADLYSSKKIMLAFTVIAVLSMLAGNLLALRQRNMKRMLAYSSIAHFGYLLVAFMAGKRAGTEAATFYLTVYTITILLAFSLITLLSSSSDEAADTDHYVGLFWRKPLLAFLWCIVLLSLAGIPLTAGFMGKFLLLTASVGKGNWLLAVTLVVSSVIGLYYYLRFLFAMMQTTATATVVKGPLFNFSPIGVLILTALGGIVLWVGLFPSWIINLINGII
jgi:NADH-quinone oxidoreductase subunit N